MDSKANFGCPSAWALVNTFNSFGADRPILITAHLTGFTYPFRTVVIPEHPMEIMPSGYTRLEAWLNAWSAFAEGRGPGPDHPDEK